MMPRPALNFAIAFAHWWNSRCGKASARRLDPAREKSKANRANALRSNGAYKHSGADPLITAMRFAIV
jgi:hypothetical protein